MTVLFRTAILAACVISAADCGYATTTCWRGIIREVAEEEQKKGGTVQVVRVRLTWSSYGREGALLTQILPPETVVLLDGKLSNVSDGMKPGYLVRCCSDVHYYECFSEPGKLPREQAEPGPANGVYRLVLDRGWGILERARRKQKDEKFSHDKMALALHVAVRGGKMEAVAATCEYGAISSRNRGGPGRSIPSVPLHAGAVQVTGAKVAATCSLVPEENDIVVFKHNGEEGKIVLSLDLAVDGASVSGGYTAKGPGEDSTGTLTGTLSAFPVLGPDFTCWVRTANFPKPVHAMWLVWQKQGDSWRADNWAKGKTHPHDGMEIDQCKLNGIHLNAAIRVPGKEESWNRMEIEAAVIGDLVAGHVRWTTPDGSLHRGWLRGEILAADTPRVCGFNEGAVKQKLRTEKLREPVPRSKPEPVAKDPISLPEL